jgi:DNA-binding transcriptional MerR regulator
VPDPLLVLREYRRLAPWNVRDLAATAGAILARSRVRPIAASASAAPAERTIRFYVARRLLGPPEGRGTAASYSYRHLLQLLAIKLRQMEGGTLKTIARELAESTGDVLERRVAAALGDRLPAPEDLPVAAAGRAYHHRAPGPDLPSSAGCWRRIELAPGVELHLSTAHPLAASPEAADAIASTLQAAFAAALTHRQA